MGLACMIAVMFVAVVGQEHYPEKFYEELALDSNNGNDVLNYGLDNTELIMSFVVFRHGDRTPDPLELQKYPTNQNSDNMFFPYGTTSLTNKGKQRGYLVGEYLRRRYDNLISKLYLPNEIIVRTTNTSRTKMTALTALSAMYNPPRAQRWNPFLNWQPVPYDTISDADDDLLYFINCPRYPILKQKIYNLPEIKRKLKSYEGVFKFLTVKTGANISTPQDVFFLDNLFQAFSNIGVKPPKWALDVMPKIKEITRLEFTSEFYNNELIKLASGVLLADVLNASNAAIEGDRIQPKLRLYSAHETNVAAFMAAIRVFKPHQPKYGATISLELRKRLLSDQYGFTAVYAAEGGGPGVVLPIAGCEAQEFCDYESFVRLTKDNVLSRSNYKNACFP